MGDPEQLRHLKSKWAIAGARSQRFPVRWIWSLRASKAIENQIEGQDLFAMIYMPGYGLAGCFIAPIVQDDDRRSIFARVVRLQPDAGSAQSICEAEPARQSLNSHPLAVIHS